MNITRLTVVNACLASMGEDPINSLAETNSFVNSSLFALEQATLNEQMQGWWFNRETIKLLPDVNGKYVVPTDVIDFEADTNPPWMSLRQNRVYNNHSGEYHTGASPLRANVIRLVPFDDLPLIARRMIKAAAVLMFQQSYDGDAAKIRDAETEYTMARNQMRIQHIRAVKATLGTRGYDTVALSMYDYPGRLRAPR